MALSALTMLAFEIFGFVDQPFQDPQWLNRLISGIVLVLFQIATLFGLNEARRLGSRPSAFVGMILAIFPCCNLTILLIFPIFLPIWGLVLLFRPEIKAMFESHWDKSPE